MKNKQNGEEKEWICLNKSSKRSKCNTLENKKDIETKNRFTILEDYLEETPYNINNPFGVDFNILNKTMNEIINNQCFKQSASYSYQADLANHKKNSPKKKNQQQKNVLVTSSRKKATDLIESEYREKENLSE